MTLHLNERVLEREERLTGIHSLPSRHTEIEVEVPSYGHWTNQVGKLNPAERVEYVVETKAHDEEFVEAARFGPFLMPGIWRFDMPRAPEEEAAADFISTGRRRSVFRIREVHHGRVEPGVKLRVLGL